MEILLRLAADLPGPLTAGLTTVIALAVTACLVARAAERVMRGRAAVIAARASGCRCDGSAAAVRSHCDRIAVPRRDAPPEECRTPGVD